jgi:hypothetical protein
MIESGLIWWEHYIPWADELILKLQKPPVWLIDLSLTKYSPGAVRLLNTVAYSEPFIAFDPEVDGAEYVSCLYLRYERREISWATFLRESGAHLDAIQGSAECRLMFSRLTEYRHKEFSLDLERQQATEVQAHYCDDIASMSATFAPFQAAFRKALQST